MTDHPPRSEVEGAPDFETPLASDRSWQERLEKAAITHLRAAWKEGRAVDDIDFKQEDDLYAIAEHLCEEIRALAPSPRAEPVATSEYRPGPLRYAFVRGVKAGGSMMSRDEAMDLAKKVYPDAPVTAPRLVPSAAVPPVSSAGRGEAGEGEDVLRGVAARLRAKAGYVADHAEHAWLQSLATEIERVLGGAL